MKKELELWQRRLRKRTEQKALFGASADPRPLVGYGLLLLIIVVGPIILSACGEGTGEPTPSFAVATGPYTPPALISLPQTITAADGAPMVPPAEKENKK